MADFGIGEYLAIASAVASTAATAYSSDQARSSGNKARDQAQAQSQKTQQASDEANNRANSKSPDVAAMLGSIMNAGKVGQGSTSLTGPQGIDPSQLTLGRSTLLGGGP